MISMEDGASDSFIITSLVVRGLKTPDITQFATKYSHRQLTHLLQPNKQNYLRGNVFQFIPTQHS